MSVGWLDTMLVSKSSPSSIEHATYSTNLFLAPKPRFLSSQSTFPHRHTAAAMTLDPIFNEPTIFSTTENTYTLRDWEWRSIRQVESKLCRCFDYLSAWNIGWLTKQVSGSSYNDAVEQVANVAVVMRNITSSNIWLAKIDERQSLTESHTHTDNYYLMRILSNQEEIKGGK